MDTPEMEPTIDCNSVQISVSDAGDRVWINTADGGNIGRFSKRFGIDVHTTTADQLAGSNPCLFCTHHRATEADWQAFRKAMLEHHQVNVPNHLIRF